MGCNITNQTLEMCPLCGVKLAIDIGDLEANHTCTSCEYDQHTETKKRVSEVGNSIADAFYARGIGSCIIKEHDITIDIAMYLARLLYYIPLSE